MTTSPDENYTCMFEQTLQNPTWYSSTSKPKSHIAYCHPVCFLPPPNILIPIPVSNTTVPYSTKDRTTTLLTHAQTRTKHGCQTTAQLGRLYIQKHNTHQNKIKPKHNIHQIYQVIFTTCSKNTPQKSTDHAKLSDELTRYIGKITPLSNHCTHSPIFHPYNITCAYHHHLADNQINKLTYTLQQLLDILNAMTPQTSFTMTHDHYQIPYTPTVTQNYTATS